MNIVCKFTMPGSGISAAEARISLPNNLTIDSTWAPSIRGVGYVYQGRNNATSMNALATGGQGYLTFSEQDSGNNSLTSRNASSIFAASTTYSFKATVAIAEWTQATEVDLFKAGDYGPTEYTPTFNGLSSVTNISCTHSRQGAYLSIDCKFTVGGSSAAEARIGLPSGITTASSAIIPALKRADGGWAYDTAGALSGQMLMEPGVGYLTFGLQGSSDPGLTKQNGSAIFGAGRVVSLNARFPAADSNGNWTTFPIGVAANNPKIISAAVETDCASTPCTITRQSGTTSDGFSSITRAVGAVYTANIASGTYPTAPYSCSVQIGNTSAASSCILSSLITSAGFDFVCLNTSGSAIDSKFYITCTGPR
jgi:hypothetical protein